VQEFFTEAFDGVLITDFWAAYDSVEAADRQKCLPHLLRELEKVDQHNHSGEWQAFAKKLRRLLRDAIRLRKRPDFAPGKFQGLVDRLNARRTSSSRGNSWTSCAPKALGMGCISICTVRSMCRGWRTPRGT